MKCNIVMTAIALVVSALLGYLMYSLAGTQEHADFAGIVSGLSFSVTLIPVFGLSFDTNTLTVNEKMLAGVAFTILLITNLIFVNTKLAMPYYWIVIVLVSLIYVAIAYALTSTHQF